MIKKFFLENIKFFKILFFLIGDIFFIFLSVFLAFFVRFEGFIPNQYLLNIKAIIFFAILFTIPLFYFFKLYSFSWSYVSTEELISLIKATFLSSLLLIASYFVLRDHPLFSGFPRSTLFITYFFIFFLCGFLRFAKRIYLYLFFPKEKSEKIKVLIVGAGDEGEQILRNIKNSPKTNYLPLGFVDDNLSRQNSLIHGVKVLGKIEDIPRLVREKNVEEIIIALPSGSPKIKMAVELARQAKVKKIKILPSISEIISGEVSLSSLKEIDLEDLLGREPVRLDTKLIENFIKNKIVLVTGAAGSIGWELSFKIAQFKPSSLLLLDRDETGIFNLLNQMEDKFSKLNKKGIVADIRDKEKIEKIFDEQKPDVVFHAAAYKHVPLMEEYPEEAVKNNVFGTEIVAEAAIKAESEKLIFISTDKAVNPTSVMGATKRVGEMLCQILNKKGKTKFISVRFGNVLDSRGSVIPIFKEQIKKGGPVTVTHPEMRRYFMLNSEACLLVLEAAAFGKGGEVFVLDMGKPIKILDLAKEMIKLAGFEPDKDIPIVFTGLRPGEKLFEEILMAEEGVNETKYEKIFVAKLKEIDEEEFFENFKKLKAVVEKGKKKEIIDVLKKIVPNYNPQC